MPPLCNLFRGFFMPHQTADSFRSEIAMRCKAWSPEEDTFLAGEIVNQWADRESFCRNMCFQQAEVLKRDAVLGELLYQMKHKLCRLGRGGGWSTWLKQQKIPRSTADRLVLEDAEFYGLTGGLLHRDIAEPLDGNVCQAAHRTADRLDNMLKSSRSRMNFVKVLADLFGLKVDWEGEGVRLSIPPPVDDDNPENYVVPPIIEVQEDGTIRPFNYELKDEA